MLDTRGLLKPLRENVRPRREHGDEPLWDDQCGEDELLKAAMIVVFSRGCWAHATIHSWVGYRFNAED